MHFQLNRIQQIISVALLSIALAACSDLAGDVQIVETVEPATITQTSEIALPPETPDVANGQAIFQQNCTSCHGATGAGDGELVESGEVPRMGSFLDPVHMRQQSVEFYYDIITNGNLVNLMPPWSEALSLQERWDVAMYVYTLHYTPEQIARGEELAPEVPASIELESDTTLAASTGYEGEDAFAALAYQRVQSVDNWGVSAADIVPDVPEMTLETANFSGTITQGSPNAELPSNLRLQLQYGDFIETSEVIEGTIGDNGQFTFTDVPALPDSTYFAVVFYDGRAFLSERIDSEELQADNSADITVYETSNAPNIVNQTRMELTFDFLAVPELGSGLVVNQFAIYENPTDYVFHLEPEGQDLRVSLLVSLPVGAIFLEQPEQSSFIPVQDQYSLIDTRPVYPGEHTIETSYFVAYEGIAKTVDIQVNNRFNGEVSIALVDPELSISGGGFAFAEEINLATEENPVMAKRYSATLDLQPGESIVFDIEGRVKLNTSQDSAVLTQDQLVPVLAGVVIAVILMVTGLTVYLRRNSADREIDRIQSEIQRLEKLHDGGQINHDVFQDKRKQLKQRLAELVQEQQSE